MTDAKPYRARLAVQLYTLRNLELPLEEVLKEVAAAGYAGVETVGTQGADAETLRRALEASGLVVASSHVALAELERDLKGVLAFQKAVGNDTVVVPYVGPGERAEDAGAWRAFGARLGALGERCRDKGVTLLYHNHDFEMALLDGKTALEHLLDGAPEGTLGIELDLAWVVRGGRDPLQLLETFSGKLTRVHVKDVAPAGENEDEDGWADVGYGTLDWQSLLSAAEAAGAAWFVVEHDAPKDPLGSIRRSAAYLKGRW
ncbi:sugar phosphate isomerase/epimerase family protein [Truepera radiovictrix]|uniref:Xylose isomerase domain protein TIM barrel n=1 Tax=Truepera radiovictrix (strain DSM 17093 / CIP 108686 / LMG 22925 / RQ-24) TaxID=649638 RepID=D7CUN7_TRURR|nr:sugar phosphate isomerase/epimerase [Truepera radiovictrix]ADI14028.1 Xylose isomerase domain protein TIM barrel [Truepera radiovictrix DSM 17093]WMT57412.1 sugar phosphate isomerase/epimerase [Truepera radiovictrix]